MKIQNLPTCEAPGVVLAKQLSLHITHVQAYVFRSPSAVPVRTSFGIMKDRPAVFVRVQTSDGAVGWGEIWCNFPACGAEHRAKLLETVVAPLLLQREWADPAQAYLAATRQTAVLAIQSGEPGPLAQVIAGVDLALWDLCARRAGLPLYKVLGGVRSRVPVYASGINPEGPLAVVQAKHREGYRAFKLKIGFDPVLDVRNASDLREWLGPEAALMVDANQAWNLEQATAMLAALTPLKLGWLEEPLRADRPWDEWLQLREQCSIPLAAGENILGHEAFEAALQKRALDVVQPDVAKWGGISGCWPVIQRIRETGLRFCPHFLGAGLGLMASAHVLAAAGGDGMLEVDSNENVLRSLLAPPFQQVQDGWIDLGDEPGMGVVPELAVIQRACP